MKSLSEEHEIFLKNGGPFNLSRGFIKIAGKDSVDFLHRITTQDIKSLKIGDESQGALLNGNAVILALFKIFKYDDYFLLSLESSQLKKAMDELEKLHFAEDLTITDVSSEYRSVILNGVQTQMTKTEYEKLNKNDFLSTELWNLLQAECGHFTLGVDITDKNTIVEAPLARSIANNKGCYPGQEVVERVATYGSVSKRLAGLNLTGEVIKPVDKRIRLLSGNNDAGYITSVHYFPWSKKYFAFGIVRKPFYEQGYKLTIENSKVEGEVVRLPLN